MDAAAEIGRNPVSKHQIQPGHGEEQAVPCSADNEQDLRVNLSLGIRDDHTFISNDHTIYNVWSHI